MYKGLIMLISVLDITNADGFCQIWDAGWFGIAPLTWNDNKINGKLKMANAAILKNKLNFYICHFTQINVLF
jgi:hypothetical protein